MFGLILYLANVNSWSKLAKIEIEEFGSSGNKNAWTAFKRLVISYSYDNASLSNMKKHQFPSFELTSHAHMDVIEGRCNLETNDSLSVTNGKH